MLKRTAIMILKKITSVIIFPILFHTSSCALIPDDYMPQITAENMAAGFFEALKNKDISEANTYLSLSALNGKEKYSVSLYDFMDYMD